MVVCRMQLNGEQYIPLPRKNIPQYIAAIYPTMITSESHAGIFGNDDLAVVITKEVIKDSLPNLLEKTAWK